MCDFALMSALVGMFVPGLNLIFSEVSFGVIDEELPDRHLNYAVTRAHNQFRLVEMTAEGREYQVASPLLPVFRLLLLRVCGRHGPSLRPASFSVGAH